MLPLLPLVFIFGEIYIFTMAIENFGILNSVALYLAPSFLGVLVLRYTQAVWMQFQQQVAKGEQPEARIFSSVALMISGILFLIPTFTTRALAIPLFLPGFRHLIIFLLKRKFTEAIRNGGVNVFWRQERDVTRSSEPTGATATSSSESIIDVKPISVSHSVKPTDSSEKE